MSAVMIPDTSGHIVREFVVSNYQKFYDLIPFDILDLSPIGEGKALVTYRIAYEPSLRDRPGNERAVSTSSSPSKRLSGWG